MASRTSRIKRLGWRIPYRIARAFVVAVSFIHHRPYMVAYLRLLRLFGMKFAGKPRYISATATFDDLNKITLGDRVVIASDVMFLTHDYALTTGLIASGDEPRADVARVLPIEVGNNVFIGFRSVVLPDTKIGNNVIVGAGSVVRGRVPDDSIYVGNPGVIVGKVSEYGAKCKKLIERGCVRCD